MLLVVDRPGLPVRQRPPQAGPIRLVPVARAAPALGAGRGGRVVGAAGMTGPHPPGLQYKLVKADKPPTNRFNSHCGLDIYARRRTKTTQGDT